MGLNKIFNQPMQKAGMHVERSLLPGQIIRGNILKIYPKNQALIQLGTTQLHAQLEVALSVGKNYIFQVKENDPHVHLQVVTEQSNQSNPRNMTNLFNQLGMKDTEHATRFVNLLFAHHIPFKKEEVTKALSILEGSKGKQVAQQVLIEMFQKRLPFTPSVFQAMLSQHGEVSLTQQIEDLLSFLSHAKIESAISEKLVGQLQDLRTNSQYGQYATHNKAYFLDAIRQTIQLLGLSYEQNLSEKMVPQQNIKTLLLQLIQQNEGKAIQQHAQNFLHIIHGLQLQSVQDSNGFFQSYLTIPGEKLGLHQDVNLKFESPETSEGKMNEDYCRIFFDLELQALKKTLIDMKVQKRTVTITVYNQTENMKQVFQPLELSLKKRLEKLDYQLSNITYKRLSDKGEKAIKEIKSTTYRGVDFKI
ncbi:hypothetical protein ACFFIS_11505 [Virgibacillus soli]|uniref:Flagellar hook-length control protein FliK n=1 Tax=Paracerasibacillus soli TaxID=480284 RepID=A0ABU5CQQ9_9BACI|nr:hypothetical protein [Virgibacillus soli]MDY0408147.1 hypothetical protein [Virgibacillus soli]